MAIANKEQRTVSSASYELIRHGFDNMDFPLTLTDEEIIARFTATGKEIRALKEASPDTPWDPTVTRLCSWCPFRVRCETDRADKKESSWTV